ncbi:MAG: hypothetical protein CMC13_13060 [Flavobacteriaceae bacterium]|nr:hypothetical protein [Flavobacteriaceae bacterium]
MQIKQMISVVIPLYNKSAYVERAVFSVLQQTYVNFELIIVNDGSTDDSDVVVSKISDHRIKYYNQLNKGVSAARNAGVSKANHAYIAFLDADDWWEPSYLAEMVKAIQKYPEEAIFAAGRTHVFQNKSVVYANSCIPKNSIIGLVNHYNCLSKGLPAIHSSNCVVKKKHFLNIGGFNERMNHFEDHECWLRLCLNQSIVFVNKPLAFYDKSTSDSASQQVCASSDLNVYFETIRTVKQELSPMLKLKFKKFYRRFAIWSYLKFAETFSDEDHAMLYHYYAQMLSKGELMILGHLKHTQIVPLYQRAKKIVDGRS